MQLSYDLRIAFRTLCKSPAFTAVAVLTLALGIGATTALWSVLDTVLLHPFPYAHSERLATPAVISADRQITKFPAPVFVAFQRQNRSFEDLIGIAFLSVFFKSRGLMEDLPGCWVTPNTFSFLGVKPALGREVIPSDGQPNSPPVVVISDAFWARAFNRDPKILGATLTLNGASRTVIAVMPPRFRFADRDIWLPLAMTDNTFISGYGLQPNEIWVVGRLKPGITRQSASAELTNISRQFKTAYPAWFGPTYTITVGSLIDDSVGQFKKILLGLLAAAGLLLLIACSNVSNLMLARATARENEMLIRASVGATAWHITRQLLLEAGFLALASSLAGLLIAFAALKGIVAAIPKDTVPPEVVISIGPLTLLITLAVGFLTAILCAFAPALYIFRRELRPGPSAAGKAATASVRHGKLRSALVVCEITFSFTLLIASGLLIRTLLALENVGIGFDPSMVAYADLSVPEGAHDTAVQKRVLIRKVLDHVSTLPGVIAAADSSSPPPYSFGWSEVLLLGRPTPEGPGTTFQMCSEDYFRTLSRTLLSGRLLSRDDVENARPVLVVNQAFARAYFPGGSAIGSRLRLTTFESWAADWRANLSFEIVGLIADAKNRGVQDPAIPEIYFPHTITGTGPRVILIRTAASAASFLPTLAREIAAVAPDAAISERGSVATYLQASYYSQPRFTLIVIAIFAGVGLLLTWIGIFAVMAYTVSLRTRELGIRVALGAQRKDVLSIVLANGLTLILTGATLGMALSLEAGHLLQSQIWGVPPRDLLTFAATFAVILTAGFAACLLPAHKATQLDPWVSLRAE